MDGSPFHHEGGSSAAPKSSKDDKRKQTVIAVGTVIVVVITWMMYRRSKASAASAPQPLNSDGGVGSAGSDGSAVNSPDTSGLGGVLASLGQQLGVLQGEHNADQSTIAGLQTKIKTLTTHKPHGKPVMGHKPGHTPAKPGTSKVTITELQRRIANLRYDISGHRGKESAAVIQKQQREIANYQHHIDLMQHHPATPKKAAPAKKAAHPATH